MYIFFSNITILSIISMTFSQLFCYKYRKMSLKSFIRGLHVNKLTSLKKHFSLIVREFLE